jgi:hypothetical protein
MYHIHHIETLCPKHVIKWEGISRESAVTNGAGVPSWIPCVYFAGAPAVGNLGRRIYGDLSQRTPRT